MRNKSTERKRKLASKTLLSQSVKAISPPQVPHETLSLIETTQTNEVRMRQLTDYLSPMTVATEERRMLEEQWESDKEDRIRPYCQ